MKTRKKISSLLCLLFLTSICCTTLAMAAPQLSSSLSPDDIQAQMDLQEDALDAYNDIIAGVRSGSIDEDVYAGAYIDGDDIVILLTDLSIPHKNAVLSSTDKPYAVTFEQAEYSLKSLEAQLNDAVSMLSEYPITDYGFYESENKGFIRVAASHLAQARSEIPTTYTRSGSSIIIEEGTYETPSAQLIGGMVEDDRTLGFCGLYGVYNAVVTAGHGLSVGDVLDHGYVISKKFEDGGYGDYAFLLLDDGHTMTNKVYGSSGTINISTVYSSTPENTLVYAYGKNSGFRSGKVTETNVTVAYNNYNYVEIRGNVRCSVVSTMPAMGDSGGPVYRTSGSLHGACGIQSTINTTNSTWTFTPFENIASMFTPLTWSS